MGIKSDSNFPILKYGVFYGIYGWGNYKELRELSSSIIILAPGRVHSDLGISHK